MSELERLIRQWRDRPYSGSYFDGGESTDWEALDGILDGKRVEYSLELMSWMVDGKKTTGPRSL